MPTILEALQSGQCFKTPAGNIWKLVNGKTYQWLTDGVWKESMFGFFSNCDVEYVKDPSIPPKPTLESLPAWTRCKVMSVNEPRAGAFDAVKHPGGSFCHYNSGGNLPWVNVKLLSIYNPKTEKWEDV